MNITHATTLHVVLLPEHTTLGKNPPRAASQIFILTGKNIFLPIVEIKLKFLPKYIQYCDNMLGIQALFVFCPHCQPAAVEMMSKMKDTKTIKSFYPIFVVLLHQLSLLHCYRSCYIWREYQHTLQFPQTFYQLGDF